MTDAQVLSLDSPEQGHPVLYKACSPSGRHTTDTSGRGANSSGELSVKEMQSLTARAEYHIVPLSTSTAVLPACYFGSSAELDSFMKNAKRICTGLERKKGRRASLNIGGTQDEHRKRGFLRPAGQ